MRIGDRDLNIVWRRGAQPAVLLQVKLLLGAFEQAVTPQQARELAARLQAAADAAEGRAGG